MNKIKVLMSLSVLTMLLVGCGGGLSTKCKDLYNESISYSQRDADVLKSLIESNGETMSQNLGSSFFHLTVDEKETWDAYQFDDEMNKNLTLSNAITSDTKKLNDLYRTITSFTETDEEKDKARVKLGELVQEILDSYTLEELDLKTY